MSGSIDLYTIIGFIESGNSLSAIRFEPSVYSKSSLVNSVAQSVMQFNLCDRNTALVIASMSFGKCQVMGFNLYSHVIRYSKTIAEYLNSDSDQRETFNAFVEAHSINYSPMALANSYAMRAHFAAVYNGSVRNYEPLIESAIKHYGFVS